MSLAIQMCQLGAFVVGFIIALWKTAAWFGAQLHALEGLRGDMAEGFRRNDEAHAELRAELVSHAVKLGEHDALLRSKDWG